MNNSRNDAPRLLPRFSLPTAFLLLTIVGLSIMVALLWREVGPLRTEIRRIRTHQWVRFGISDPKKVFAVRIPPYFEDDSWQWRIYLPPGHQYSLCEYVGHLPFRATDADNSWYEEVRAEGFGFTDSSAWIQGAFDIEVSLIHDNEGWKLVRTVTHFDDKVATQTTRELSIPQHPSDWLSTKYFRHPLSDVTENQKPFEPGEPILLLHIQRPDIIERPDGSYEIRSPQGSADGVAVWLEPQSAPASPSKP